MNTEETSTMERSLQRRLNMRTDVLCRSARVQTVDSRVGNNTPYAQRGVALIVSLVLLAAMTIIGVATLSGTRLNEQMASNAQQKSIAFEVAESAIGSVSDYDLLIAAITSDPNASFDNPAQVPVPDAISGLDAGYDLVDGDGKGIDIDGTLGVQYCGETQPVGTSLNAELGNGALSAILVDINSEVGIANTSARTDHLLRVTVPGAQTGRKGNCPARY